MRLELLRWSETLICYPPVWLSRTWEEGDEKLHSLRREEKKRKKKTPNILVRFLFNSLLIKTSKGWVPRQLSKQGLKLLQSLCREFAGTCPAPCPWEDARSRVPESYGILPEKLLQFKQVQLSKPGAAAPWGPGYQVPVLRHLTHRSVCLFCAFPATPKISVQGPVGHSCRLHLEKLIA